MQKGAAPVAYARIRKKWEGLGLGALNKLNAMDIKVYKASDTSVEENAKLFVGGTLPEITIDDTCSGHGTCDH